MPAGPARARAPKQIFDNSPAVAARKKPTTPPTHPAATDCPRRVACRRVAAAYGVAHLALRTPFYVQNHDSRPTTAVSRQWTR